MDEVFSKVPLEICFATFNIDASYEVLVISSDGVTLPIELGCVESAFVLRTLRIDQFNPYVLSTAAG